MDIQDCTGCKHHIGAGLCRMNLERECGEGGHEAYEERETRKYSETEFLDAAVSCYWGSEKATRAYISEHHKHVYTDDDLVQLWRETPEGYLSDGKHRHVIATYGQTTVSTKSYRTYNGHDV